VTLTKWADRAPAAHTMPIFRTGIVLSTTSWSRPPGSTAVRVCLSSRYGRLLGATCGIEVLHRANFGLLWACCSNPAVFKECSILPMAMILIVSRVLC
jgi:hypothetical protein